MIKKLFFNIIILKQSKFGVRKKQKGISNFVKKKKLRYDGSNFKKERAEN